MVKDKTTWTKREFQLLITEVMGDGGWFRIHRAILEEIGPEKSLVLHYLINYHQRIIHSSGYVWSNGWFFCQVQKMEDEINLSYKVQRRILLDLITGDDSWIETRQRGIPAKRFFRINVVKVASTIAKWSNKRKPKNGQITSPAEMGITRDSEMGIDSYKDVSKKPLRGKPLSGGDKRRHARDGLLAGPFHRTAAGHLRAVLMENDSDLTAPKPPKRAVSIDTLAGVIQRICVDRAASEDEVKAVIKWLKLAYADPYTPKMRKPDDLSTHWGKYRDAMRRWYADRDQPNPVDKVKRSSKTQVEHVVGRIMQEHGLNPYADDPSQAMVDEALVELGAAAGSIKAEDLWE